MADFNRHVNPIHDLLEAVSLKYGYELSILPLMVAYISVAEVQKCRLMSYSRRNRPVGIDLRIDDINRTPSSELSDL